MYTAHGTYSYSTLTPYKFLLFSPIESVTARRAEHLLCLRDLGLSHSIVGALGCWGEVSTYESMGNLLARMGDIFHEQLL